MEGCVMMDAVETIQTIDRVKLAFCEKCWNAVQTKLKKEGFETALGGSTGI
jgi:predicted Zn-dependent protease